MAIVAGFALNLSFSATTGTTYLSGTATYSAIAHMSPPFRVRMLNRMWLSTPHRYRGRQGTLRRFEHLFLYRLSKCAMPHAICGREYHDCRWKLILLFSFDTSPFIVVYPSKRKYELISDFILGINIVVFLCWLRVDCLFCKS